MFESNSSYFTVLALDIRDGCWWYGSRGWTFPPVFVSFVAVRQIAAEEQFVKMASDM
jgi:hypothetical protein